MIPMTRAELLASARQDFAMFVFLCFYELNSAEKLSWGWHHESHLSLPWCKHSAWRERLQSCGLTDFEIGSVLWEEEGFSLEEPGHGGWAHRVYLVRVQAFENAPQLDLSEEGSHEERWFTVEELAGLPTRPDDLAERIKRLQPG